MKYQNNDDDDNMIYASDVPKTDLWHELNKLRDRVRELEHEITKLKSDE